MAKKQNKNGEGEMEEVVDSEIVDSEIVDYDLSRYIMTASDAEIAASIGSGSGFQFLPEDQKRIAAIVGKMVTDGRKYSAIRLDTLDTDTKLLGYSPLKNAIVKAIEAAGASVMKNPENLRLYMVRIRQNYQKKGRAAIFGIE